MSAGPVTWRTRTAGVLLGAAIALAGLVVVAWPEATTVVVGFLLGIGLVLYGVRELALGPELHDPAARRTATAIGIVSALVGLAVLLMPLLTATAIGLVVGVAWIVEGGASLVAAVSAGGDHRLLRGAVGVISLVAGIAVVAQPTLSLVAIVWFTGAWLLAVGIVVALFALAGRRAA